MFSCLQILEAFLWFVLITLLNVTLIILTLSVSRLLNLLLRLVAFLLFLNPQFLASISRWITASSAWKRFCLFFFFQVEDGIRDVAVTGVQTCALPIFVRRGHPIMRRRSRRPGGVGGRRGRAVAGGAHRRTPPPLPRHPGGDPTGQRLRPWRGAPRRSGERLGGEECRSRVAPDHLKKKK